MDKNTKLAIKRMRDIQKDPCRLCKETGYD